MSRTRLLRMGLALVLLSGASAFGQNSATVDRRLRELERAAESTLSIKTVAGGGPVTGAHLAHASALAVTEGKTLVIAHPVVITTAVGTVAANLRFEGGCASGGCLKANTGGSVTLTGALSAPLTQIFDTSGGGTITVSSTQIPQRWAEWWGLSASASAATNAAALNAALASVPSSGAEVTYRGSVSVDATLSIAAARTTLTLPAGTLTSTADPVVSITAGSVTIRGAGYFATELYASSATSTAIYANGGVPGISGVDIKDMTIPCHSGANTRTAGYGIRLVKVGNWRLSGLYLRDPWIGISVDNSNTGFADNVTMDTTLAAQSISRGVEVANTSVSNHFRNVFVTSAATAINAGFYIGRETDTLTCYSCGVQAAGTAGAAYGFTFATDGGSYKPRWIKIIGPFVEVDKTTGIAFQIDHVADLTLEEPYSAWGLYNYHVTANAKSVRIQGGLGVLAYQYGALIEGGTDITIDGLQISDASQQTNTTYDGIALSGGTNVRITNCTSGNSFWAGASPASATNFQRYGVLTTGAVDNYAVTNCDLRNSLGTGGISDTATGTNKQVFGNRINGGVGTTVGGALSPPSDAGAIQAGRVYQGSGVPNNANGNNGDFYLRTDTPATANQRVYNKQAGAWVGIL